MNIEKIDRNFAAKKADENGVVWYDVTEPPFAVHGVFYDEESGRFLRIPRAAASAVGENIVELSNHTAGGRVRFYTDSERISVRAELNTVWHLTQIPRTASAGFALYAETKGGDCVYVGGCSAPWDGTSVDALIEVESSGAVSSREVVSYTLYMPIYAGVSKLRIGVKEGCAVTAPRTSFRYDKPIVFYGSSITQGGCASRAGNDYVSVVCRRLGADHVNLGLAGNARAEEAMCDYIAGLEMAALVYDYDHNAPSVEFLERTHGPFFERFRARRPDVPVLIVSRPDSWGGDADRRCAVIMRTYLAALGKGDRHVAFVDGRSFFASPERFDFTVDGVHPTDLGFRLMSDILTPTLKSLL